MKDALKPMLVPYPTEVELSGAELEHARAAYRGSLQAVRAQRAISPSARHQDTACWSMLGSLFIEPGMNRTMLVGRIVEYAGVSCPTAERVVRRARDSGHIIDQPSGRMVRYFLSEGAFACCVDYFRKYMQQSEAIGHLYENRVCNRT